MRSFGFLDVFSFGPGGWGRPMMTAAAMTLAVAVVGFFIGVAIGLFGAWGKIAGARGVRALCHAYTSILRGVPDLLIVYLFYFGSSAVLTPLGRLFGASGFVSLPSFLAGAVAIGVVSGAYQTETLRGAYGAVSKGEIEAAKAVGMGRGLAFRRIIGPLTLRYALPGMGNIWQSALKDSSLISVTGLVEILRQAQIGGGSTRKPFTFFVAAALLYLVISVISGLLTQRLENRLMRGTGRR